MNLFCCFRKKKSTDVKVGVFETVNVLVTDDRFTDMSDISDYSKGISFSFFNKEDDDIAIINDLMDELIWHVEIKNLF
jgi:hypothetical protein